MAQSRSTDWLIFLVTTLATIALLYVAPQWFWLILPFPITYAVKALGFM